MIDELLAATPATVGIVAHVSLDAVRALNTRLGLRLEVTGTDDAGQSGAVFVRRPDGSQVVVTTALTSLAHMEQTRDVLDMAREQGIPVPRHHELLRLDDGTVAVVQERLAGQVVRKPTDEHVRALVAMNERFAGLLSDRPDVPAPTLSLGRRDDPTPTDLIAAHSERARRFLARIEKLAVSAPNTVTGTDLVHVDLTIPNTLFADGPTITGLVDWNYGVARGDRRFAIGKLLHNLSYAAMAPDDVQHPQPSALAAAEDATAAALDPETLRRYWAHWTINALYGNRRWGTEQAFLRYLDLGEQRLV